MHSRGACDEPRLATGVVLAGPRQSARTQPARLSRRAAERRPAAGGAGARGSRVSRRVRPARSESRPGQSGESRHDKRNFDRRYLNSDDFE